LAKSYGEALQNSGLKPYCKSNFNLLKHHETGQLPIYLILFEEMMGMSAETGENSLIRVVSRLYQHTNKKEPLPQMVRYAHLTDAVNYVRETMTTVPGFLEADEDAEVDMEIGTINGQENYITEQIYSNEDEELPEIQDEVENICSNMDW
jgi:hypothetical protein